MCYSLAVSTFPFIRETERTITGIKHKILFVLLQSASGDVQL